MEEHCQNELESVSEAYLCYIKEMFYELASSIGEWMLNGSWVSTKET